MGKNKDNIFMVIVFLIYSLFAAIATLSMSLFYVVTCFFFLILPKYKRYKLFDSLVVYPWTFIFNKLILFMRITVIGRKNVDRKRTTLYICNHQSWVDIPTAIKYTHTITLSKKQVRRLPLVGVLIIYASPIIVDRDDKSSRLGSLKEIIHCLKKGYSINMFPEGTRSRDGKLIKPNKAVIRLCFKLNIPVVSTALEGTRDILPRNRIYLKPLRRVVIKFNDPIYPKDFTNEDEFADACWEKVKESHNGILKEYFPDRYNDNELDN